MNDRPCSKLELIEIVLSQLLIVILLLLAMFFLPAGTFAYWEAWAYLAVLLVPMFMVLISLYRITSDLLERRMRLKEKKTEQSMFIKISY